MLTNGDPIDDQHLFRKIHSNPRRYFAKRFLVLGVLILGLVVLTIGFFVDVNTPKRSAFTGDNEILVIAIILIFTLYYYRQTRKAYRAYNKMKLHVQGNPHSQ